MMVSASSESESNSSNHTFNFRHVTKREFLFTRLLPQNSTKSLETNNKIIKVYYEK